MAEEGFDLLPGEHPISPVMFGDAVAGRRRSPTRCSTHGVYVIAFSYPVVPQGKARIRVQLSAAHSDGRRRDLRARLRRRPRRGRELTGDFMRTHLARQHTMRLSGVSPLVS